MILLTIRITIKVQSTVQFFRVLIEWSNWIINYYTINNETSGISLLLNSFALWNGVYKIIITYLHKNVR